MDFERRFGGLVRLYGADGANHIQAAHVVVIGVGGVGSWAAEALVRSGVGALSLIDFDQVSESNVNRQIHALDDTLGMAKVDALQARFAQINPQCRVHAVEAFVEWQTLEREANWPALLPEEPFAVIDACDQVRAKTLLAAWAIQTGTPFISVGAAGGKELAQLVELCDLSEVTHDPLLAQLRSRLRREYGAARQGKIGVRCVFSRESVKQPEAVCLAGDYAQRDNSLNCHGYGSVVSVTATFGMVAAGQILHDLAYPRA